MTKPHASIINEPADPRDLPSYNISKAAQYLGVSKYTLRSWVAGRSYPKRRGTGFSEPLVKSADDKSRLLSFNNLVEGHVLSSTRQLYGLRLPQVRKAIEYVQSQWPSPHP